MTSRSKGDQLPIAIVGIGCRFPGGITDAESFWRVVRDGVDAITEIPANRIDVDRFYDARPATPGRMMSRRGGFLDRIDEFDPEFFGISPREAKAIDPQQRLLLEVAWEALEDAGQDVRALEGSSTGVFVGQWMNDFESRLFADPESIDFFAANGGGRYSTSGRISYALGLRGASLTVDTACSSSLVAIHLAVRSLRSGESTLALAGGVNVILQPQITIAYSQSRMMAPDGRCKFGDASGDGYVRSEGAGLVLLKPLPQALADGDRVYAVIRGSAVNNDGHSSGSMSTPSRVGQEELLRSAYSDAAVKPGQVGMVEAHGVGTRAGDPVELGALGAVLREARDSRQSAYIGSVKTNFGHTESAAGVAGLIKLALSLHHRQIPRSLHFQEPNPTIPWAELPFEMATELIEWPEPLSGARIGGVNSFGVSGTNAHVVLEEAPPTGITPGPEPSAPALLVLSAKNQHALRELAARYRDLIAAHSDRSVHDVCWSAATRRTALEHRAAFVAATREDLEESLRAYAAGEPADVVEGRAGSVPPRLAFVCPGHGAQWVGMARDMIVNEPVFRAAIEECDAAAKRYVPWSVMEQIQAARGDANFLMDRVDVVQPVLLSLTIAYARLMAAMGIVPDALVGHSMGEASAAYLAGVIDLDWAMRITCRRSIFMQRTAGQGAMALIDLPADEVQGRLASRGIAETVTIGVVNSPRSCVVSGDPQAIGELLATLEAESVFCRLVKVDVASHSAQMDSVVGSLVPELSGLTPAPERTPIFSTLLARRATGGEFDSEYWGKNIRDTVLLGPAVASMLDNDCALFVEIGPHPVVLPSIEQTANALRKQATTLSVARRDQPERMAWLRAAAGLWCSGRQIDWQILFRQTGNAVWLPSYPWQRERHWLRVRESGHARDRGIQPRASLADDHYAWLHVLRWVESPAVSASAPRSGGRALLLITNATTDRQLYADAFAREHSAIQIASSVNDAIEILRGPRAANVADIVLLASDTEEPPHEVLTLVKSLVDCDGARRPPRLTIATCGAQTVEGHERPRVAVHQAALWGLGRVISEEHPEVWGGLVDLDPTSDEETQASQLAVEMSAVGRKTQMALRADRRFELRFQALEAEPVEPAATPFPTDGAWLVTGGLGAVSLHLAAGMVAQGVRRLVLVNRTGLPPRAQWNAAPVDSRDGRRIAAVRAIEAAGAAVHLIVADVADTADLERALKSYEDEAWPPIKGVLHAAGVLETALVTQTDRERMHRAFAPKLRGALNLERLLPGVERFILVSSISATLGVSGSASYAAANAALDAFAHDRRARGAHGFSVQFGSWLDTGMQSGASAEEVIKQLRAIGVEGFTPAQGVAIFTALAGRSEAGITVMPIDWSMFAAARHGRDLALYDGRIARDASDSASSASGAAFSERLAAGTAIERHQLMEQVVREAVGRVLKLAPARVDPRKALGSMGLNSLMAMELRNRLETTLGRPLSATLAWNYPTVDGLVAFLSGDTPPGPVPVTQPAAVSRGVGVEAVASLSDADAALLLRRKR